MSGFTVSSTRTISTQQYNVYEVVPQRQHSTQDPDYSSQTLDAFIDVDGDGKLSKDDIVIDFNYESFSESCPARYHGGKFEYTTRESSEPLKVPEKRLRVIGHISKKDAEQIFDDAVLRRGVSESLLEYFNTRTSRNCGPALPLR